MLACVPRIGVEQQQAGLVPTEHPSSGSGVRDLEQPDLSALVFMLLLRLVRLRLVAPGSSSCGLACPAPAGGETLISAIKFASATAACAAVVTMNEDLQLGAGQATGEGKAIILRWPLTVALMVPISFLLPLVALMFGWLSRSLLRVSADLLSSLATEAPFLWG